ncbi:MAG: hypothetical protein LBC88_00690, partial [Spirochaetaceae bacterium]|nr:hypothetical protein [Spirochaetaceae bacterium]
DLYLYHDRAGLYWHIPSAEWVEIEFEGKFWIGSRDIAPPPGENLPRGQFRAVLVDQGGEKSERSFTFDAPAEPRFPFPDLVILDGQYTVTSSYPANHLIFYDVSGAEISVKTLMAATGSIAGLSPPNGAVGAALWGEDAEYSSAALTDIVPLRRIR